MFRRNTQAGFTMVEILVALGILSALLMFGLPVYRRLVQNALRNEAVSSLGSLYMAEKSFFTAYLTYGNNIGYQDVLDANAVSTNTSVVGYPLDRPIPATAFSTADLGPRYSVGFPTTTCGSAAAYIPPNGSVQSQAINQNQPRYYIPGGLAPITVWGRVLPGPNPKCLTGLLPNPFNTFTATATGCISPGCVASSPLTGVSSSTNPIQDQWTIDDNRQLTNVVDGSIR